LTGVSFTEETGCSCLDGLPDPTSPLPPPESPLLATELEAVRGGADSVKWRTIFYEIISKNDKKNEKQIPRTFNRHFIVVVVVLSRQSDLGIFN
jgi:hypothetical protein